MIPLHDLEPSPRTPVATRLLLLLIALAWVWVLTLADRPAALEAFYERWSFDPADLISAIRGGGDVTAAALPLMTHQFLHAGWLHVLGNALYLWIFGDNVEGHFGTGPFLVFYLLVGAIAAVGQGLASPGPMVGASGAIAGVLGAYVVISPAARIRTLVFLGIFITVVTLPAIVVIGEWIVIQVISGFGPLRIAEHTATANVAYVAHVVGFVSGIALCRPFRGGRR